MNDVTKTLQFPRRGGTDPKAMAHNVLRPPHRHRQRCASVLYMRGHALAASWCISAPVSEGQSCNDVGAQRGAEAKNNPVILVSLQASGRTGTP